MKSRDKLFVLREFLDICFQFVFSSCLHHSNKEPSTMPFNTGLGIIIGVGALTRIYNLPFVEELKIYFMLSGTVTIWSIFELEICLHWGKLHV